MPIPLLIISAAATVYSAVKQNQAAKKAAAVETATSDYNAKIDLAKSAQLDLDTKQNIQTERQENSVYLSKQAASYASAGVLSNTGSALDAQLTTTGRLEQHLQQKWVDMNQQQATYASSAVVGRLEGSARADADKAQGTIALINGGAKLASQLYGGYQSGTFSGGGGGGTFGS